jgi:RNA polymerase sigma factor (sigma-70 family)
MNRLERQFAQTVKENKSTIYTVCFMFSKDSTEVDDMFQEVLINLWRGYEKFRGESSVGTWIWKVSLNTCITHDRKKRHRLSTVPLDMNINLYEDTDSNSKQIRILYNRISKLGPLDRAIVLLWLDNMSYDDIAAIMGMSVKNVSVKLVRIKEQLKNMNNGNE